MKTLCCTKVFDFIFLIIRSNQNHVQGSCPIYKMNFHMLYGVYDSCSLPERITQLFLLCLFLSNWFSPFSADVLFMPCTKRQNSCFKFSFFIWWERPQSNRVKHLLISAKLYTRFNGFLWALSRKKFPFSRIFAKSRLCLVCNGCILLIKSRNLG